MNDIIKIIKFIHKYIIYNQNIKSNTNYIIKNTSPFSFTGGYQIIQDMLYIFYRQNNLTIKHSIMMCLVLQIISNTAENCVFKKQNLHRYHQALKVQFLELKIGGICIFLAQ